MLQHRRAQEQAAQERVRTAHAALRAAQARLDAARRELLACSAPHCRRESAERLASGRRYAARLRARVAAESESVRRAQTALHEAQAALTGAGQDRLAVEKLVHSRELELRADEAKAAQTEADDRSRLTAIDGEG